MSFTDYFSPVIIGIIVSAIGLFGGAMFWLGRLHQRLSTLEQDVNGLKETMRQLSIRFEANLLSRRELDRINRQGTRDNE